MQIGILSDWNEKQFEAKQKKGEKVLVGISAESLLGDIEIALYRTKYDPATTLQLLQHDLMILTGRIVEQKSEGKA